MLSIRRQTMRSTIRVALASAMAAMVQVALPVTSHAAGTVWVEDGTLHVVAARGAANDILVSYSNGRYRVVDSHTLTVGPGCVMPLGRLDLGASCEAQGVTAVVIDARDQDDEVDYSGTTPVAIYGRAGDDTLAGGYGNDRLYGGRNADRLENGVGNDALSGGKGKDLLMAGLTPTTADADVFTGGPGLDTVTYSGRSESVRVRIDGVANDGAQSEADDVKTDVEMLFGSRADDELVGSSRPDRIHGGDGNDTIDGADGFDELAGGNGDDHLFGSLGWDNLYGGPGADMCDVGFGGGQEWDCEG